MILAINTQLPVPIYEQLREQIILGIAAKQLLPEEGLPSVRRLAADLGINLHTVNKAYNILCDEGYMVMDRRKGATVAKHIPTDENFTAQLSHNLKLAAAEAKCRDMTEAQFLQLCKACYAHIENDQAGKGEIHE